ncbi:MAG: CvpA family protein [Alloprevotella sp.]|nr:CvpA family protein [Alloprevotella sp.]
MFIDIFLIVLLLWSAYSGWRQGFLKEVVSALGFLVGLLIAATCYSQLGEYLTQAGSQMGALTNVVAFLLLWIIVPIVLGFAANMLTKALKGMKLGLPNSLLGALVSIVKFAVLISCVLNVMSGLRILDEEKTQGSRLFEPARGLLSMLFSHADFGDGIAPQEDTLQADTLWVDFGRNPES